MSSLTPDRRVNLIANPHIVIGSAEMKRDRHAPKAGFWRILA